jgi:Putative Ig domain
MVRSNRGVTAPFVGYVVCALAAAILTGCGGGDAGSASAATPAAQAASQATLVPPTISGTPNTTIVAGAQYSFQPSASDTSGDALTFSIQNMPSWATFDTSSGLLSGTPTAANVGTSAPITISVADGKAISDLPPFTIQVTAAPTPPTPPSDPPTISGTPATSVQAGSHYAFQPSTTDPSGGVLTFSITGKPAWAAFNTSTGLLSGTPASANVGSYSGITVSVSDGQHSVSLAAFAIQVTAVPVSPPANTPPTISGTPATTVQAGSAYSFEPAAADADGNTLTFAITNKPSWANFSTSTGQLSGTPSSANVGIYSGITITVSDGKAAVSLPAFSVQVTAAPVPPPTISGTPATSVQAGNPYSFTPAASDPGASTLSFSIQNVPSWASFSIATGQLSGTPTSSNVGSYSNIVISVSNGTAKAALASFNITVTAAPTTNGTATLHWTPPTLNTNGTALTNLAGYKINYGISASSLAQTVQITDPAATNGTVTGLTSGTWYFAVISYNSDGTSSALSSVVSKTFP